MKTKTFQILLALCLASGTFVTSAEPATLPAAASALQRWECCSLTHDGAEVLGDERLAAKIVALGEEGWELVTVSTVVKDGTTTKTIFYFKRPKQGAR